MSGMTDNANDSAPTHDEVMRREFASLVARAKLIAADMGEEVEAVLRAGIEQPLPPEEAARLLTTAVEVMKRSAESRGDTASRAALEAKVSGLIDQVISIRSRLMPGSEGRRRPPLVLVEYNGIPPKPVLPSPVFHGRTVHMNAGFVKLTDLSLWEHNERLDIHLAQFQQKNGHRPSPQQLLEIMQSKMDLPGIPGGDEFQIVELAHSIAINGVRKPPIIDTDGTLLDGDRRIAACFFILHSNDFSTEHKARANNLLVWQLTEHATEDERNAVVTSLNFEDDCKQPWPEYVKARKVYEEWQAMVMLEPTPPGSQRQAAMKRTLSQRFALGPDTTVVNRYLKMIEWANEFEDYQINTKSKDEFEVKHRTNEYFQYFDEIAKGAKVGGVAWSLGQDDAFKHLVFDLLYDGKFKNWRQIRELKVIFDNQDAREALTRAREERDPEAAEEHLENAMTLARRARAEERELGANTRIESFVKWLEELPIKSFRDTIKPDNLRRLLAALRLAARYAKDVLGETE